MCENVPLAAPELGQGHGDPSERRGVPPGSAAGLGEPAWEAFYALVFAASAILVEAAPLDPARRIAASVALAAMVPWYLVLARPVMRLPDEDAWQRAAAGWRGPLYLTGVTALLAVALYANPNAWFLAFALSPQCFSMTTPMRRAMGFVILLNATAGVMFALNSLSAQTVGTAVGTVLFAVAFSQVYSRWMLRVIEQSHERASLIAELESAQAELAAVSHEAGVLAERQRLAAEIHDTLAQGFLSIITLIQAARPAAPAAGYQAGAGAGHLDLALATARENLAEARALVAALTPASLDAGGLAGALARAAGAAGQAAGFAARCVTVGAARPLPTTSEVVLLRVCQEALANVRQHAAAGRVEVRLRYDQDAVELLVTDDGRGFVLSAGEAADPGAAGTPAGTGFGLRGMRERLRQAGGTLTVESGPGDGTVVRARVPG